MSVSAPTTTTSLPVGDHIHASVAGLTINVDDVVSCAAAGIILLGIGFYVRAKATSGVPGRWQLAFETIVDAVQRQIDSSMGEAGRPIVPLALTLFLYILIANSFALIPSGHNPEYFPPPTSDVNFPLAMAAFVIIAVHVTWIRRQGLKRYVGHYFKPYIAMFPINVVEELTKPITLTLRLFGNLFAGGIMLLLFTSLFKPIYILPIPIADFGWKLFDGLFVGPIQAFIFALLTILYFQSAIAGEH